MAYSYAVTVASGSTSHVTVPFKYIKQADVHVYIDGVEVAQDTLSWIDSATIDLPSTPASGKAVKVQRTTEVTDLITKLASATVLDYRDWNNGMLQLLYVCQEAFDASDDANTAIQNVIDFINTAMAAVQEASDAAAASAAAASQDADDAAQALADTLAAKTAALADIATAVTDGQATLGSTSSTLATALNDLATSLETDLNQIKTDTQTFKDAAETAKTAAETARDEAVAAAESVGNPAPNDATFLTSTDETARLPNSTVLDVSGKADKDQKFLLTEPDAEYPNATVTSKGSSSDITTGTEDTKFVTPKAVRDAINAILVGMTVIDSVGRDPDRALLKDGSLVSRTTYAALWNYVSAYAVSEAAWSGGQSGMFSVGDGSTTFRLPDDRGAFLRGTDGGRGLDSGRAQGTYQADALKTHTHGFTYSSLQPGGSTGYADGSGQSTDVSGTTGNPSTGTAPETRPKNNAVRFFVRY